MTAPAKDPAPTSPSDTGCGRGVVWVDVPEHAQGTTTVEIKSGYHAIGAD